MVFGHGFDSRLVHFLIRGKSHEQVMLMAFFVFQIKLQVHIGKCKNVVFYTRTIKREYGGHDYGKISRTNN